MKNKLCKRLLVGAMACSLLLSGVGGMNSVYAEETTSEQDSGYDVDKPVIESISIDKQGQTISKDTPVKISVKAYDLGSGIRSVEICVASEASNTSYQVSASYNDVTGCYEYTILNAEINSSAFNGKTYLTSVTVRDNNGNSAYGTVGSGIHASDKDDALYWFNYQTDDMVKPTIDSIEVTPAGGTVTVGDKVEILVKASDNVAIDTKRNPRIRFWNDTTGTNTTMYKEVSTTLSWDDSKQGFYGVINITKETAPVTYNHGSVYDVYDTSGNVNSRSVTDFPNAWFTVDNPNADMEAPVIKNISMTHVGETVGVGDEITISVEATDNVGVSSVTVALYPATASSFSDSKFLGLSKKENSDVFSTTIKVDSSWYATEWYMASVEVSDTSNNSLSARGFDGKSYINAVGSVLGDGYELQEKYYVNVNQNGNFVLPSYDVWFIYSLPGGSSETESIKVPRRTKVSDLAEYTKDIALPEIPDVNMTGWKTYDGLSGMNLVLSPKTYYAQYDKEKVHFHLYKETEDGKEIIETKTLWGEAGKKIKTPAFDGYKDLQWYWGELGRYVDFNIYEFAGTDTIVVRQASDDDLYDSDNDYFAKVTDANISTDNKDNTGDNNNTGNNGNTNGNNGSSDNSNNSGNTNNSGNNNNTNNSGSNGNGSNSTITPAKPAVTLPKTKIAEIVTEIKSAKTGVTIKVDMDDATVVPKEILKQAQGKDVNVVLEMNGYTWTINGKNIAASDLQDINLEVTRNTNYIPSGIVSAIAGNNPVEQISLTYNGNFGFKAELTINVGKQCYGKYGNLYYYDSDGKMVLMNAGAIDKDGNVTLGFSHASEYAIVITDVPASQNQSDGHAQTGQNLSSPKTGDTSVNYLYIMMVLAGTVLFAMLAYGLMKDKSNAK